MTKNKKKPQRNQLKNLLSQMVDGNAACATITTLRVELSASDARKCETKKTMKVNQSTSDKWKTRRLKPSLLDKTVKINQDLNSIKRLTTRWLKNMVSSNKIPWETGPVKDAVTTTIPLENSAICAISLTLKATECSTPKPSKDF